MNLVTLVNFLLTATVLLLKLDSSFAGHPIVGVPPSFTQNGESQDVVVSTEIFNSAGEVMANLVLPCGVTGDPIPTVTWYRGDTVLPAESVTSDGSLAMNVTEGVDASRDGVLYHCEASNVFGGNGSPAVLRSRDVNVTYTFFDGFASTADVPVDVLVIEGQAVSLECDFLLSNPPPTIEWRDNNGVIVEDTPANQNLNQIFFTDQGRYLVITILTASQISQTYRCTATGLLLNNTMMMSPTRYTLNNSLPINELKVYREMGTVIGIVGEENLDLYQIMASHDETANPGATLSRCSVVGRDDITVTVFNILIARITSMIPEPVGSNRNLEVSCQVIGAGVATTVPTGTVLISAPARVSSPPAGDPELSRRELLVGGGGVTLVCGLGGSPVPTATWYHNGDPASGVDGIAINGNELIIAGPQVAHSGIYQCFVKNVYGQVTNDDQRAWVLEIREPLTPAVVPLTENNTDARVDRLEGTVIVPENDFLNFVVEVVVNSDPCPPTVFWTFQGSNITGGDMYTFNDPCAVGGLPPHIFTLTIANLTTATSGRYSATFANLAGSVSLPGLLISVPKEDEIFGILIDYVSGPSPTCLLDNSVAQLTCNSTGFPRPNIRFLKGSEPILPDEEGFGRFTQMFPDQIFLSGIVMGDAGLYSCEVTGSLNVIRSDRSFEYCSLSDIVSTAMEPTNPVAGDTLRLECVVTGDPTPVVTWIKDDVSLSSSSSPQISITISPDGMAVLSISSITVEDSGVYLCNATNIASNDFQRFNVQIGGRGISSFFTSTVIIGLVCGIVGAILVITLMAVLLICVYYCAKKSKSGSTDFQPYNVDLPDKGSNYTDGRGNVDDDSDDGVQPEAFSPEYESLPALRPSQPPPYKQTPGYEHGAPLEGDDLEMIKYPPQDSESFVGGGLPYRPDNGYRPSADDFLSEDAQFV